MSTEALVSIFQPFEYWIDTDTQVHHPEQESKNDIVNRPVPH